jgi:hypothetical protein
MLLSSCLEDEVRTMLHPLIRGWGEDEKNSLYTIRG